jgi:hypothetical protein
MRVLRDFRVGVDVVERVSVSDRERTEAKPCGFEFPHSHSGVSCISDFEVTGPTV